MKDLPHHASWTPPNTGAISTSAHALFVCGIDQRQSTSTGALSPFQTQHLREPRLSLSSPPLPTPLRKQINIHLEPWILPETEVHFSAHAPCIAKGSFNPAWTSVEPSGCPAEINCPREGVRSQEGRASDPGKLRVTCAGSPNPQTRTMMD